MIFDFFYFFGFPKDKKSKMLNGPVWYVKRCAFKRRFQKYVTFINRFIIRRVMAETPKLKKTGFLFLIIKGSIFNIFTLYCVLTCIYIFDPKAHQRLALQFEEMVADLYSYVDPKVHHRLALLFEEKGPRSSWLCWSNWCAVWIPLLSFLFLSVILLYRWKYEKTCFKMNPLKYDSIHRTTFGSTTQSLDQPLNAWIHRTMLGFTTQSLDQPINAWIKPHNDRIHRTTIGSTTQWLDLPLIAWIHRTMIDFTEQPLAPPHNDWIYHSMLGSTAQW